MVAMLGCAEKDEMYLLAIIHQHLIISGDVELNPGPLGGEQILHSLGVCYCIILQSTNISGWTPSSLFTYSWTPLNSEHLRYNGQF